MSSLRQDSTGSLVSVNSLSSTGSIASHSVPKTLPSKLSNIFSSEMVSSSLSTLKAGKIRADSIVEPSSDTNPIFGAHKRTQDTEEERDRALSYARDARDAQQKAQIWIQELEDTLKFVEAELGSQAKIIDALTSSSDGSQSQIHSLEVDLQKVVSISKNVEERDRALAHGREANDAQIASKDTVELSFRLSTESPFIDRPTAPTFIRTTASQST
ncbi:hypothetical protein BDN70DRAFT_946344, partial [Pholiota conissans]